MLGQDAFLQLLIAQLQNQDPLQPTDGTTFVTQLSQFSMVQQSVQQSTQLSGIASQLQNLGNTAATALIGKTVSLQNTGVQWNGTFATTSSVTLAAPAQSVQVTVQDSNGNVVRNMTLGAQNAGPLSITWDGQTDAGQPAPSGAYTLAVTAAAANGQAVNVSQTVSGTVTQVSLGASGASVTLSNGASGPVSQLVGVTGTSATAGQSSGNSSSTTP